MMITTKSLLWSSDFYRLALLPNVRFRAMNFTVNHRNLNANSERSTHIRPEISFISYRVHPVYLWSFDAAVLILHNKVLCALQKI